MLQRAASSCKIVGMLHTVGMTEVQGCSLKALEAATRGLQNNFSYCYTGWRSALPAEPSLHVVSSKKSCLWHVLWHLLYLNLRVYKFGGMHCHS